MGIRHVRALVAVATALLAASIEAHEIGTTRVNVVFRRDHTYSIDLVTSAASLQQRHVDSAGVANAIEVRFDDQRVAPRMTRTGAAQFHFEGDIPQRARDFTWQYGLTFATYALTAQNEGSAPETQWIGGDDRSRPFALAEAVVPPSRAAVANQYLLLGFTHIVPYGLDHILFVLGIFLLAMRWKPILSQVTAFTIAHSITLGLTIYGVVSISPRIVEPMIALSIAFIAIENLTTTRVRPWRVAVVFAFGLLHGMGFAGVLKELGLPRSEFLTALITFNLGIELAQLAVIFAAFAVVGWWSEHPSFRRLLLVPSSAAIAATGLFWTVQRLM